MKRVLLILIAVILIVLPAKAEIILSQPKAIYNIGDLLEISASLKATDETDSVFSIILKCQNSSVEISSESLYLEKGGEYNVDKKRPLTSLFLRGAEGSCVIESRYGNEIEYTGMFKITDRINVIIAASKMSVKPGERIVLKINAIKENLQSAEGFAEISTGDIILKGVVSKGKLEINFSFPEDAKSGNHEISVLVYEKSKEELTNSAEEKIIIEVKQIPKKLELITDRQDVIPGESIKFIPEIYDQAGDFVFGEVKFEVMSKGKIILEKLVEIGEEIVLEIEENSSYGEWKARASALGLEDIREFYVQELEKASFNIAGDILEVKNIGNVPYEENVQVSIDDRTEIIEVNLKVGESRSFRMSAPDGNYYVRINDGIYELAEEGVALTGNAIGIKDARGNFALFNRYPVVWIFLILVLGMFVFVLSQRVLKKKFYGYVPKEEKMKENPVKAERTENIVKLSLLRKIEEAEHSLVLHGRKEESGVLALKIKNFNALGKNSQDSLNKAAEIIKENKGAVCRNNESILGIFSPSATKTFKNELAAIKTASLISSHLNEHNKKFSEKIDFGIGINSGEIAVQIENGKLKFTPLGNSVSFAKKIADSAVNSALISSAVNKKVMPEVKTLKQGEFYSISRIIEREQNKDFLNKFKERNRF